jgi:hypothetical protein
LALEDFAALRFWRLKILPRFGFGFGAGDLRRAAVLALDKI